MRRLPYHAFARLLRKTIISVMLLTFILISAPTQAQTTTPVGTLSGCWSTYLQQAAGAELGRFSAVTALSPNDIWAVGGHFATPDNSSALISHWDGAAWRSYSGLSSTSNINALTAVSAVSKDSVWAVSAYRSESAGGIAVVHWNGRHWSQMPAPKLNGIRAELVSMAALSDNDIWAVGADYSNSTSTGAEKALIVHWDGSSWSIAPIPSIGGRLSALRGIVAASANDIGL